MNWIAKDCPLMEPDGLESFPISPNQRRFWILDQLEPGNAAYHISICLRLIGPLSRASLERSVLATVARQEALRSRFVTHNGEPMLVVASRGSADLQVLDLSEVPESEVEAKAHWLVHEETRKPFDLSRGPLIRAMLLMLAPTHHILVCTIHHIVCDGWSAELLVREFAEHYEALMEGRAPSVEPLAFSYSSYAVLHDLALSSDHINRQLSYWRGVLAGAPALLDLQPGRKRPEHPTHRGESFTVPLDAEMIEEVQRLARKRRSTLFMVLTSAFGALVSLLSQQTDIVIGIPVTGRDRVETESLIGLFVNTIALRTSFVQNPSFVEILDQTRERLLDAMSHQEAPFERVVDAIGAHRNPDYNPIFQIMFSMFSAAVQSRRFGPLTAVPYVIENGAARVDLSLNVIQGVEHMWWLQAEYRRDLFDRAYVSDVLAAYVALLRTVLRDADRRLSEIGVAIIRTRDDRQLLGGVGSNPTAAGAIAHFNKSAPAPVEASHFSNEIELALISLWAKALGVPRVQIDDDFFSVGGHSLMAISLILEINRTFGIKLPVSMLLREPTIRRLAQRIRRRVFGGSSFVALSASGQRPALFVAANNYRVRHLVDAFGPDQPLYQLDAYALQEERLISAKPLFSTVQEMATQFVSQIIAVQGTGPYFLAGQCDGAIIAIEIANQLKRLGHNIASLMVFDTPVTGYFQIPPWHRRVLIAAKLGDLPQRVFRTLIRRLRGSSMQQPALIGDPTIWTAIWEAIAAYGTDYVFDGTIVFFRATEFPTITGDLAEGWDRVAKLKVIDVPGDHQRLFSSGNAQTIIKNELVDMQGCFLVGPELSASRSSGNRH
jgi:thioesterase domain-containing protein/acyl carrier protein